MITKISLEKNISNFAENQEIIFDKEKINVIYGLNATGKTTISRLLNSISKSNTLEEKERLKKLISNYNCKEDAKYFILNEGKELNDEYIKVFNNDYIEEKIGKKSFDSNKFEVINDIDQNLKNPLEDIYRQLKNDKDLLTNKKEEKSKILELSIIKEFDTKKKQMNMTRKINDQIKKQIFDNIKDKVIVNLQDKANLLKRYSAISNVDVQNKFENEKIEKEDFADLLKKLKSILEFNEEISENKYIEQVLNLTDQIKKRWILEGIKHIKSDDKCPFCNSMQSKELLNEYKKYEKSQIKEITAELEKVQSKFEEIFNSYVESNTYLIGKFSDNKDIIDNYQETKNQVDEIRKITHEIYGEIKTIIDNKFENINKNCIETYNSKIDKQCSKLNVYNQKIIKKVNEINNIITRSSQEQDNIRKQYLEEIIIPEIANKYEQDYKKISEINSKITEIEPKVRDAEINYKKDLESKNILIRTMNKNLELLNIYKYKVNSKFQLELKNKNINMSYRNYLSEGEKTSIVLALFISELETSKTNEIINVLVFDDPISSLDYDNIYNIYYIIKNKWDKMKDSTQFIILTHNNVFYNCLKYYQNCCVFSKLIKNQNDQTEIEKDKLIKSIYMEKLRVINNIKNSDRISEEQKLFIPNFCRYVFETQAYFLYPNTNNPMEDFAKNILQQKEKIVINTVKLNKYLGMCNAGSHAQITEILDGEDVTDYRELCTTCIKITKYFFSNQINNI